MHARVPAPAGVRVRRDTEDAPHAPVRMAGPPDPVVHRPGRLRRQRPRPPRMIGHEHREIPVRLGQSGPQCGSRFRVPVSRAAHGGQRVERHLPRPQHFPGVAGHGASYKTHGPYANQPVQGASRRFLTVGACLECTPRSYVEVMTVMETTSTSTDTCAGPRPQNRRPDGEDQYTISEVAALTGLTAHTLRWYERIGLMPHIDRSHTGQRRYTNRDLDWLDLVGKLRLTGMPVADMVRYAEMVREGDHTYGERFELLKATREDVLARIAELQGTLAVLDRKISFYADAGRALASERSR
ncbi:hypothetical protein GCM10027074_05500 [Streptomyces deserti]